MQFRMRDVVCLCAGFFLTVSISGCGSDNTAELGQIEGTVKLGGKPLPNAEVVFHPKKGRPSSGTTDENGHYELEYRPGVMGAVVGEHTVKIRTYREADPGSNQKAVSEQVPAQYNANTTLQKTVKPGDNDAIDFNLEKKGKIILPDKEDREDEGERDCC